MDASRCWLDATLHWLSILHDLQRLTPLFTSSLVFLFCSVQMLVWKQIIYFLVQPFMTNLRVFCLFCLKQIELCRKKQQHLTIPRLTALVLLINHNQAHCIFSCFVWVCGSAVPCGGNEWRAAADITRLWGQMWGGHQTNLCFWGEAARGMLLPPFPTPSQLWN